MLTHGKCGLTPAREALILILNSNIESNLAIESEVPQNSSCFVHLCHVSGSHAFDFKEALIKSQEWSARDFVPN